MRKHAGSIKADEVMDRARKVASTVIEREMGGIDGDAVRLGWHPGFGTMGIFIDRDFVRELNHEKAFDMASTIAREFDGMAGAKGPHAIFDQKHLIVGFCPDDLVQFRGLR